MNLADINEVKILQSNLRASLETDQGKEVMKWLEELCGWYDLGDTQTEIVLNKNGRRQVLATVKTLLECTAEQIVAVATKEEY